MLIQQLLKLSEGPDQKFVLALKSGKTRKLKGYFVADDEDVTSNASAALDFSSKAEARDCAAECNRSWDLEDGDSFDIIKLEDAKNLNEEYNTSADWDADMEKLQKHLKDAQAILESKDWTQHVKDTEDNFGIESLQQLQKELHEAIADAVEQAETFYELMEQAA